MKTLTQHQYDVWKIGSLKILGRIYCELCEEEIKGGSWYRQKKYGPCVHEVCLKKAGEELRKEAKK